MGYGLFFPGPFCRSFYWLQVVSYKLQLVTCNLELAINKKIGETSRKRKDRSLPFPRNKKLEGSAAEAAEYKILQFLI